MKLKKTTPAEISKCFFSPDLEKGEGGCVCVFVVRLYS